MIALLTGMMIPDSKPESGKLMPEKPVLLSFWIVGTDREAIKREVAKKLDALFDACQRDKTLGE